MLGYLLIGAGLGLILQEIGDKKGGEANEKNDSSVVVNNISRKLDSTAETAGGASSVIAEPQKAPKEVENDDKRNDDQGEFSSSPGGAGDNLSN